MSKKVSTKKEERKLSNLKSPKSTNESGHITTLEPVWATVPKQVGLQRPSVHVDALATTSTACHHFELQTLTRSSIDIGLVSTPCQF